MSKIIVIVSLLFLCGADDCTPKTIHKANPNTLSYIKDDRTGLCFAKYSDGGAESNSSIALVPCDKLSKISTTTVENQ